VSCNLHGRLNEEATIGVGVGEDTAELVLADVGDPVMVAPTSNDRVKCMSDDWSNGLYTNVSWMIIWMAFRTYAFWIGFEVTRVGIAIDSIPRLVGIAGVKDTL
jgi:hypothetical protein